MKTTSFTLISFFLLAIKINAFAQATKEPLFDEYSKSQIIREVANDLKVNYVFEDTAIDMISYLNKRFKDGAYKKIERPSDFADTLTRDLRSIYFDHHLSVHYDPDFFSILTNPKTINGQQAPSEIEEAKKSNFGFNKLEILKGNIGYVNLNQFYPENKHSKETVNAVFRFLENTGAVIIDLRSNIGGEPEMVRLICNYLFDHKVHINDLYERRANKTLSYITTPVDISSSFKSKPVYILTSHGTFSAAEEFAYDLQKLNRAAVVGENTGGGAHPVSPFPVSKGFVAFIPYQRAINPVTKTNWEGIGVLPDIKIGADSALKMAMCKAYDTLIKISDDRSVATVWRFQENLLSASLYPATIDTLRMKKFVGNYEGRLITFEENKFYFTSITGRKSELIPLNSLVLKRADGDEDDIQIQFIEGTNGQNKISIYYSDGETQTLVRN
jgi:hypothetical protein